MSLRTLNLQILLSSVTGSVFTTGVKTSQSLFTQQTFHLDQDSLRFFQLAAFYSMHLTPGKTHTPLSHQSLDVHSVYTAALFPHSDISGCYISLLFNSFIHWEQSSLYPYLHPQILRKALPKAFSSCTLEIGLSVSEFLQLSSWGGWQMLVSPSGRQPPLFWMIWGPSLLTWGGKVHIPSKEYFKNNLQYSPHRVEEDAGLAIQEIIGHLTVKFSRICVDTTW